MSLSPNHGPRRHGGPPDMVVIHYTAMAGPAEAAERLCDPKAEVSAHYLIEADGALLPLVEEPRRAWHAGVGAWGHVTDVNSHSIGIELDNRGGGDPFAAAQIDALCDLLTGVFARWNIPPERVIGHSDCAPGRKDDPGRAFPWPNLATRGVAIWPWDVAPAAAPAPDAFAQDAARFGYRAPGGDWAPVLEAFRQRFRPRAAGPLDAQDTAIMAALARRWPHHPTRGAAAAS